MIKWYLRKRTQYYLNKLFDFYLEDTSYIKYSSLEGLKESMLFY